VSQGADFGSSPFFFLWDSHLRSIRKIRRLCIVNLDGLGVEVYGGGPVMLLEGIVTLVLQRNGLCLVAL
jgi:hypothetical protein